MVVGKYFWYAHGLGSFFAGRIIYVEIITAILLGVKHDNEDDCGS